MQRKKFRERLLGWWKINGRKFPWRETSDPYKIFLSEILLHRTRANQVIEAYKDLTEKYPTVEHLATASETELNRLLRSLGLFWRTKLLTLAARRIAVSHNGQIPQDTEELMKLPGVSNYIASAVACFAYGRPEVLLDTNTVRVLGRVFGAEVTDASRRSRRFINLYRSLLDQEHAREFNYAMIDLGALVCRPADPMCELCPVLMMCQYGIAKVARKPGA